MKVGLVSHHAHEGDVTMDDYDSLRHSKWECKCHVVFTSFPSTAGRRFTGLRQHLGKVFRRPAMQKEIRVEAI